MPSPDDRHGDPLQRVRERVEDQAHDHWHEFAVIVASADVLLALVLCGRLLMTAHPDYVTGLATAVAITSTVAAMFAYYAIQVGILFVAGPLRFLEVLVSFLIAAAQLALFLWPAHVLGRHTAQRRIRARRAPALAVVLRHFQFRRPARQLARRADSQGTKRGDRRA